MDELNFESIKVTSSILSIDFGKLGKEFARISNDKQADFLNGFFEEMESLGPGKMGHQLISICDGCPDNRGGLSKVARDGLKEFSELAKKEGERDG